MKIKIETDDSLDETSDIETSLEIVKEDFIVGTDGKIDINISLKTNLGTVKFKDLKIIEEIYAEDENIRK